MQRSAPWAFLIGLIGILCLGAPARAEVPGISVPMAAPPQEPAVCLPAEARDPGKLPDGAFVRARGTRFEVAGRPFLFVGANFDPLHGEPNRARYRDTIAALASDGMTVGRIWALGEGPADASEWLRKYALFRAGPDGFIEESYRQLDRVLAEARQQGLRLILTLSNHWGDYGGLPMYLRWAGLPEEGLGYEAFYTNEQVRAYFRAGLLQLLSRTNSVTGVRYVDDPTIFSWELMNESRVTSRAGAEARREWIRDMARFIKDHDENHLVAAGLTGYDMRAERAEWVRVHKLPEIDYCDSHLYPQTSGQGRSWPRLRAFLDDRAQLSRFVINKPLLIGEFGFRTDGSRSWLGSPRKVWFGRFVERILLDGCAGALAWIYQPFMERPRDFGIYIDRSDTDDVRAALRRQARRIAGAEPMGDNPRLSAALGDALLYDPLVRLAGSPRAHGRWRRPAPGERLLLIPPEDFAEARFERAGVWKEGALVHAYGADTGRFVYRFTAPDRRPAAVRIEARMSSEWPGTAAPPDGGSTVRVLIDGAEVGRLEVVPDDGLGRFEGVTLDRPERLRRLAAGTHTLTFEVPEVPGAHGLTIYGAATGLVPPPPGEVGPIRVRYLDRR